MKDISTIFAKIRLFGYKSYIIWNFPLLYNIFGKSNISENVRLFWLL